MYKKIDCLLLPYSASALYNNLAIKENKNQKAEAVAVIHHDTIAITPIKNAVPVKSKLIRCLKFTSEKFVHVTQVTWYNLGCETVLIVTSTAGLQVFDQYGEECIFSHPCNDMNERNNESFARGIGIFNAFYFCIGNSAGCIRMFGPHDLDEEISFIDRKHNHLHAISDLSSYKDYLASVDEEGYIMLWRLESEELVHKLTVPSVSHCTGIKLRRDWLITSYGSGSIRLYVTNKGTSKNTIVSFHLSIEISAHARPITALDITDNNEYLLTVSEDNYAKVWQFYKDGNFQMLKHVTNVLIKDNMLIGCKFLTANGSKFCVSTYDSNIVTCYSL